MSYPTTIKGQKVALQLETSTPGTYATVCGIETKGFQRTRKTNEVDVWDCTDPDALPITEKELGAGDWTLSGSGFAVLAVLDDIEEAFEAISNWRIVFFGTGTTIVRSYTGSAIMTDLNIGAVNGQRASISLTLSGSGILTKDIPD